MAQFIGTISGTRGKVSRMGSKTSGLKVECNGWEDGVAVYASHNDHGQDVFEVWSTGGSNGGIPPVLLVTIFDGEAVR